MNLKVKIDIAELHCQSLIKLEQYLFFPPFNPPKSRASKILLFRHYQTDAPV